MTIYFWFDSFEDPEQREARRNFLAKDVLKKTGLVLGYGFLMESYSNMIEVHGDHRWSGDALQEIVEDGDYTSVNPGRGIDLPADYERLE